MEAVRNPRVGARPGTLAIDPAAPKPILHVTAYDESSVEEIECSTAEEIRAIKGRKAKLWVDVQGLGDERLLREMADMFDIHLLALEDLVHAVRPKSEPYEHNLLVICQLPAGVDLASISQLGIVLGADYVLTFRQRPGDELDPVRRRLRITGARVRVLGSDYLAYAILDTVVDSYFPMVEQMIETVERLQDRVISDPTPETLRELNETRGELLTLRRTVTPQREAVGMLARGESDFVGKTVQMFLRDTQDHIFQVAEAVDSTRELLAGLMGTYLSVVSQKTNDVMKVLTIVASIFVPLTFLAGIYGMNFEFMPELGFPFSYPLLLLVMGAVATGMVVFFWRKGWFQS